MRRSPRIDRDLARYLVPGERVVTAVRRHLFSQARPILLAVAVTIGAFAVDVNAPSTPGGKAMANAAWLAWFVALGWLAWRLLNWRRDFFVATDKRFLLFYGFIRRKVAMMPLTKVTDMTFDRSVTGRLVGYGSFLLESAGNDQALSAIEYVPDADEHYRAICTVLFGAGHPTDPDDGLDPHDGRDDWEDDDWEDGDGWEQPMPEPPASASTRRSLYRSADLVRADRAADTGELPVVRPLPDTRWSH